MIRIRPLAGATILLLFVGNAAAQEAGGIGFAAGGVSAANLAQAFAQPPRMPVFVNTARRGAPPGAMVTNPAVSRREVNNQAIGKIRGDAGFLGGFNKGQALALSRQAPLPAFDPTITFIEAPFIVNNFNSALNFAFGEGNVTEQQVIGAGNAEEGVPTFEANPTSPPVATPRDAAPQDMTSEVGAAEALLSTAGPLPHLPLALERGGVQFNNFNSSLNIAAGQGNFAGQTTFNVQR